MTTSTTPDFVVEELEIDDEDAGPDDYTFVLGPDGSLKTMMIPGHLMDDPPEEVQMILSLFGIENIHTLDQRPLH